MPVAKNLAMSMDQRDIGTRLAHRVAGAAKVESSTTLHESGLPEGIIAEQAERRLLGLLPELLTPCITVSALWGKCRWQLAW